MKKLLIPVFLALVFAASGCIRTSEDIRLDKELGDLKTQVDLNKQQVNDRLDRAVAGIRQNQVDMLSKLGNENENIKDLRNRIDILQHRLNELKQAFDLFTTTGGTMNTSIEQRLSALETSMTAIEAWMSFSSAYNKKSAQHHTESTIKPARLNLDAAVKLFKSGKIAEAKPVFEKFSKSGTAAQKARASFYLGETAYRAKDYKTAIADYGIIVEKYPDSPLIKSSYFMIGKSFAAIGDHKNATLFFDELISRYPNDKLSKEARKELKKLK